MYIGQVQNIPYRILRVSSSIILIAIKYNSPSNENKMYKLRRLRLKAYNNINNREERICEQGRAPLCESGSDKPNRPQLRLEEPTNAFTAGALYIRSAAKSFALPIISILLRFLTCSPDAPKGLVARPTGVYYLRLRSPSR